MRVLFTWPTYGNWYPGHGRGGFEIDPSVIDVSFPEPTLCGEQVGQAPAPWPVVRLDATQQETVLRDLQRVAALRNFALNCALVTSTFACILITLDEQRDFNRLVQLIKGATARALTVAAGDELPVDSHGETLPHHKWWSRQYAVLRFADDTTQRKAAALLQRRGGQCEDCTVWPAKHDV